MVASSDCGRAVELLPWYVRGTLGAAESEFVAAHLEGCPRCREELAEVRTMLRITGQHLPAGVLADLACGLPTAGWPPAAIEQHLATCAACHEELALARGGSPVAGSFRTGRAAAWAGWQPLALAASLVACVALGALWRQAREEPALHAVALHELVPESYRVRGSDEAESAVDATRPATLVLTTDRVVEAKAYRVRVLAPSGETIAELTDLQPDAGGVFVVHAAPGLLPPGALTLVLEAAVAGGWEPLETYRLRAGS